MQPRTCDYVIKQGQRVGQFCAFPVTSRDPATTRCKNHLGKENTPKENLPTCEYIYKNAERRGKVCNKPARRSQVDGKSYCYSHHPNVTNKKAEYHQKWIGKHKPAAPAPVPQPMPTQQQPAPPQVQPQPQLIELPPPKPKRVRRVTPKPKPKTTPEKKIEENNIPVDIEPKPNSLTDIIDQIRCNRSRGLSSAQPTATLEPSRHISAILARHAAAAYSGSRV